MPQRFTLRRTDLRGRSASAAELRANLPRGNVDVDAVLGAVRPIVTAVAERGAAAAQEFSERFDGARPERIRVPAAAIDAALAGLDPKVRAALIEAIRRVRLVHEAQRPVDHTVQVAPGGTVTQRLVAVERVGLYVPGGGAVYPSSVIMNVVPAQAAGVESLVVASPPQRDFDNLPHPTILAACALLGVTEVWAVGGAQAIALLAHGDAGPAGVGAAEAGAAGDGSEQLDPVDLITGPGNIYVTAAKRLCRGLVGIDAEAGPTEIAILADHSADPVHVAADLISQAEHDEMAAAVLVTDSEVLADAVEVALGALVPDTRHRDRIIVSLSGQQSGIVLVDDIPAGIRVVNAYAAEHLEIQTVSAREDATKIRSAGAVFVGAHSPVALGDYAAGSNHVLPTAGCARHQSGLNVRTFLRAIEVIEYDEAALKEVATVIEDLSGAEDLPAHGDAVRLRFERPPFVGPGLGSAQ